MNIRRIIAFFLLAVYLVMAAGSSVRSLSCDCVRMDGHTHHHIHSHCAHACCDDASDCAARHVSVAAPCCDDRHSTDIALYTGGDSESEKHVRCAVVLLPASLAAECPCPAHLPALRRRLVLPPVPCVADAAAGAFGLRAPPVLV